MITIRRLLFCLVCLVCAPTLPSHATLVKPFSLTALTLESHAILRGEVEDIDVLFDPVWGNVYTHTTVRVLEDLAGTVQAGDQIIVRQLGGLLDGVETRVVGNALLPLGGEVVLFTRTDGALHYLIGMAQGKYDVIRGSNDIARVARSRAGLTTFAPIMMRPAPDAMPLDALQNHIEAALAQEGR